MREIFNLKRRSRQRVLIALFLAVSAIAACTQPPPPAQVPTETSQSPFASTPKTEKRLKIVATFLPVYLFTKAVAGDAAQVDILIEPGTEVHEYQSTPDDVRTLAQTDVVVMNGLGIDAFLESTVKSVQNAKLQTIEASQGIQPLGKTSEVVSIKEGEHSHEHEGGNPHVWLDPVLAKKQVENIRDGLIAADPINKAKYEANTAAYLQQLDALNQEYERRLANYRDRTFVTFHDAFPYLANRYQLKQEAVVEIPEDQLSPADVRNTVDSIKQFKVKALLSEPGIDNKLLESLSKDLNLTLRPLDSLEAGERDPQYYFTAMRRNLQTLEAAFQ